MKRFVVSLVCLAGLLFASCGSPVDSQPQASSQIAEPSSGYCQAVQEMLIAQPSGALADEDLRISMNLYAAAAEHLADMSGPDDALVLFELAATARLVAADAGDRDAAARFGAMVVPMAPIALRASLVCGIAG